MKDNIIILPKKIPVLRDTSDERLKINVQEFNIYFKNIILPYKDEYDIQVRCQYGKNYGSFWRLSEFPYDVDSFPFELVIYNEYGELIASKTSTIELYDRKETDEPYNMIFLGDSMTFSQEYIDRVASNLYNIVFKGSRNKFGHISHEGRGGWAYNNFFNDYKDIFGVSPFLFPQGIENYMGDIDFINNVNAYPHLDYNYTGYEKHVFKEGCVYGQQDKLYLYQNGNFTLFEQNPKWEFNFKKYVNRYDIGQIDAISILLGANDLQFATYEDLENRLPEYINNTERFIKAVHEYDKNIDIIINLPVIGAEQYSWGVALGCKGSSKMYRFNIIKACKELLDNWGDSEENHIYISPMLLCVDPDNGFPKESTKANKYSESIETHQNNWVHPNYSGYCQMGDAICGVIQKIRNK